MMNPTEVALADEQRHLHCVQNLRDVPAEGTAIDQVSYTNSRSEGQFKGYL